MSKLFENLHEKIEISLKFAWKNCNFFYLGPRPSRFQTRLTPLTSLAKQFVIVIVIVISKLLKRYSKAKRTRAPAYSRALRRIKGGFPKGGSREAQVRIPEYQEGTE